MSIFHRGGLPVLAVLASMLVPAGATAANRTYGGDASNSQPTEVLFRSIWTDGGNPVKIKSFEADHVGLYCSNDNRVRTGRTTQALPQLSGTPVDGDGKFNGHMRAKEGHRVTHAHLKGGFHEGTNDAYGWIKYRVDYLAHGDHSYKVCRSKRIGWNASD